MTRCVAASREPNLARRLTSALAGPGRASPARTRARVVDHLARALADWPAESLMTCRADIERAMLTCVSDESVDVRRGARACFDVYAATWPKRAERVVETASPRARQLLLAGVLEAPEENGRWAKGERGARDDFSRDALERDPVLDDDRDDANASEDADVASRMLTSAAAEASRAPIAASAPVAWARDPAADAPAPAPPRPPFEKQPDEIRARGARGDSRRRRRGGEKIPRGVLRRASRARRRHPLGDSPAHRDGRFPRGGGVGARRGRVERAVTRSARRQRAQTRHADVHRRDDAADGDGRGSRKAPCQRRRRRRRRRRRTRGDATTMIGGGSRGTRGRRRTRRDGAHRKRDGFETRRRTRTFPCKSTWRGGRRQRRGSSASEVWAGRRLATGSRIRVAPQKTEKTRCVAYAASGTTPITRCGTCGETESSSETAAANSAANSAAELARRESGWGYSARDKRDAAANLAAGGDVGETTANRAEDDGDVASQTLTSAASESARVPIELESREARAARVRRQSEAARRLRERTRENRRERGGGGETVSRDDGATGCASGGGEDAKGGRRSRAGALPTPRGERSSQSAVGSHLLRSAHRAGGTRAGRTHEPGESRSAPRTRRVAETRGTGTEPGVTSTPRTRVSRVERSRRGGRRRGNRLRRGTVRDQRVPREFPTRDRGEASGHRRSNRAKTRDGLETRRARCVRGEGGGASQSVAGSSKTTSRFAVVEGRVRPSGVFVLALARRVAFVFVVSRRPSLPLLSFALVGFTWVWLLSPCSSF